MALEPMGEILEAFDRWVADHPQRPALWSRGEKRRISFIQLARRAEAWRGPLRSLEDRMSTRAPIALAVGNRTVFVELCIALLRAGRPFVTLDAGLAETEKVRICHRLGIPWLLHRGEGGEPLADGVRALAVPCAEPVATPPGTFLIKLTSGSTGDPVGLCFDQASLHVGIRQIGEGMALDADDRVLLTIPLSHSYGFDNGVLSLLVLGTPLVLEASKFPGPLLRALAESEATFMPLVPPLVRSLGQVEWPEGLALRRVICAGGVLRREAARAFRHASGRPVHDFYGSSETGGICFERQPLEPGATGTVGHPLPGVTIELDPEGRVVVASAANHLGRLGEPPLADRRVCTGDLGEWTPTGRLRLVGRSADFLEIGGRKVPAAKIERALLALPGVREAAVVGVADPVRGERVVAFLVTDHWPIDLKGIDRALAPRDLRRLDALPHTERGKLDRAALRGMVG